MIVETLIATVGAVTIVGTWLGLRFAEREMGIAPAATGDEQREAVQDAERYIRYDHPGDLRALLVTRPHHLLDDVRTRAQAWLDGRTS